MNDNMTISTGKPSYEELVEALKEAREALSRHWFSGDGEGGEYNNDEVIAADNRIQGLLERIAVSSGSAQHEAMGRD